MNISVINQTKGKFTDGDALRAIRAINRQIAEDFEPYWGFGGRLRLEGRSNKPGSEKDLDNLRGDAILFLVAGTNTTDDGSHWAGDRGIPHGIVYVQDGMTFDEWTVSISHEALELIADPELNLLAVGPHPDPKQNGRDVYHWYEMCDAVQGETYQIDGVTVSNFVLPLYFTSTNEHDSRNDFLGTLTGKSTLKSFGVNPGGYVMFFDPESGKDDDYSLPNDVAAEKRKALKKTLTGSRRAKRNKRGEKKSPFNLK